MKQKNTHRARGVPNQSSGNSRFRFILNFFCLSLLFLLAGISESFAQNLTQAGFTGVIVPQYMSSGSSTRLPVMYRATLTGLTANTSYRYYTNGATNSTAGGGTVDFGTTNSGAGNPLLINSTGTTYSASSGGSLSTAGNFETFTTDASGNYTGWFGFVNTGNGRFTAGNIVYPSIVINTGGTSTTVGSRRALDLGITVLALSTSAGANNGSLIQSTSSSATAKNLVAIYDNTTGTGRPLGITVVESTGATIGSVPTGYSTTGGAWNTLMPNNNTSGVRRIEQRSVVNNSIVGCATDADGTWTTGSISTVNPTNGTTFKVISNTDAPLSSCTGGGTIIITGTLSDVSTIYGTASASPSTFAASGTGLSTDISITAPSGFEISKTAGGASGYATTQTLTQSSGTVSSTTIYVRLASTTIPGTYSGNISCVSAGSTTVNVATVSSTVSAKELTVTGATALNKTYDGTTSATITGSTLVGIVNSDVVTISGTGTFAGSIVGTGITVTSTQTLSGANASNYTLSQPTGLTADITAKPLTIAGLTANNKLFDGTTTATLSGTASLNGVETADLSNVTLGGTYIADFASSAVGTGIAITVTGYTISGSASGNYSLSQPTGLTANITSTPSPLITSSLTATETYGVAITNYTITATETPTSFNAIGLPAGLSVNTSTGEISGTPTVTGTFNVTISATNAGGAGSAILVYTIGAKTLTVTGATASNKVYDATDAATITGSTLVGIVGSDDVTINGTGTFASANVGTAIIVTSTQTLSGANAANYTLTLPTSLSADITAKSLTITGVTANNKAFDGNTTATLTGTPTLVGVIAADISNVTLSGTATGTFASSAIGNGIAVAVTGYTISGIASGNYSLSQPSGLTANITAPILLAWNTFGNAGTETTEASATNNTNIAAASLNYTGSSVTPATNSNRFGGTNWAVGSLSTSNYIQFTVTPNTGFSFTPSSFDFIWDFSGTGPKSVTLRSSADSYTANLGSLTTMTASTSAIKTISISGLSNITTPTTFRLYGYDATSTGGTGGFDCASSQNNVILYGTTAAASVPTISTTGSLSAVSTTYGTASSETSFDVSGADMTAGILVTPPAGYEVSLTSGGSFTSTVTVGAAGTIASTPVYVRLTSTSTPGSYSGNIVLTSAGATTVNVATIASSVNARQLTVTGATASNKIYDATDAATITGSTLVGIVGSDVVSINATGTFVSANAGTGIAVTSTQTLAGVNASNYTLAQPTGLTADITVKPLTITGIAASNKVFDGTTTATLSGTATLVGVETADNSNVTLGGTYVADFASSAVGTGIAVTVTGYTISGSASANYSLSQPTGLTADITSAPTPVITSSLTATETYGVAITNYTIIATNTPTSFNATGLPAGLNVNTSTGEISGTPTVTGTFNVTISATNAGGTGTATLVYTINAKPLTITGATADNKVYDKTDAATISGSTLVGVVGSDDVTINNTATFTSVTVGNAIVVTSTQTLGGADAAKYTVTLPTGLAADITTKALTISGASAQNKTFDGNTTATITGTLDGVVSGDVVTLTLSGTFASSAVGTGIAVTSTSTIGGADAGNYTLTQPAGLTANITSGPTTLAAGDIAIISHNTSGSPSDNFTILVLKDLTAGTVFFVNDNEIATAGTSTFTELNEGEASFTVKAGQTIPAGTVINLPWGTAAVSTATYDWSATSGAGLGASGDEIYIYTAPLITSTTATTFIYYSKIGTGGVGAIPAGLTLGTTSIAPATTPAYRYKTSGALYTGCQTALLTSIGNTVSNWDTTGATAIASGDWTFNVLSACSEISTTGTLNALSTTYGTASSETSFNVSGVGMTAGILVTAPSGYELSLTSGGSFTSTVTVGAAGTIASTPVYVRLASTTTPGSYSGNIVLTSAGATTVNVATVASTVNAKQLTVTGATASNKVYDATDAATITGSTLVGIVGSDVVSINGTGTFAIANAGTGIAVTSTQTLAGANASNYTLAHPTGLTADIAVKPLTITGIAASNKVFDGTTTATLSGTATLVGVETADLSNVILGGTATATFASSAVGTGIAVTVTGYTISGSASANYSLSQTTGLIADITSTPSPIISSSLTANETYGVAITNYTITASETPTSFNATDLPAGLSVNTSTGEISGTPTVTGTFNVTISATNAGGTGTAVLVYTISAKPLTVTGATADNKVYDNNTTATISGSTLVGVVGSDVVTISNTGIFASASAGTAIAVTSTQILVGADAAKYTVTLPTGLTADITPKVLTISGAVAQNKIVDGNTTATITGGTLVGVISPDVVTLTLSGTFATAAVGTGIAVTSTSTIGGTDAGNYSLTQPTGLSANITGGLPAMTEVIFPQYIQGLNGTNANRIPFAYRATLSNLTANATYRFYNSVELTTALPAALGAGNNIYAGATQGANFTYSTGPSLSTAGNYGTFTTDSNGSFTGWFVIAPSGNATRFVPGTLLNTRIVLNDGNNGTVAATILKSNNTIKVINTVGSAGANNGTGLRGNSSALPKNFVFVYDNTTGSGRPLSGTFVENDGVAELTNFATFYTSGVDSVNGAYGMIVPNTNANGVRRIEQRAFTDASIVGCATDYDGVWPSGANTVNPTGGTTAIVITATDADLSSCCVPTSDTTVAVECDSTTWSENGMTYTASGTYVSVTSACHQEVLVLTINHGSHSSTSVTASVTYTWSVNGATYTNSGTYVYTSTNASGCTNTDSLILTITPANAILNVTAFIQGFYSGSAMVPALLNASIAGATSTDCDTITVELHNATTPYATVQTFKGVLQTNGTISCTFPGSIVGNSYYIALRHRSAVETWSAAPVAFTPTTNYDFSTSASQAYGNNQISVGSGVFGIYGADLDHDLNVALTDYVLWEVDANNFSTGYRISDLNGDANVDLLDLAIWENNATNFIYSIKP